MKKITQLYVDVSAYFTSLALTAIVCFAVFAIAYVEFCAKGTLLSSGGTLIRFFENAADWLAGFGN